MTLTLISSGAPSSIPEIKHKIGKIITTFELQLSSSLEGGEEGGRWEVDSGWGFERDMEIICK